MDLFQYKADKYTKNGNDGIIEYILNQINIKKGFFVEFGAVDGIHKSNCRKLFDEGWSGLFIEVNKNHYKSLKNNYKEYEQIFCIGAQVGLTGDKTFDNIVDPYLKGRQVDFCSIDIDGLDLEVFETFEKYLPTVVCIEGGQAFHPYHKRVKHLVERNCIQQSLSVMVDVFEKKGYKILCSHQDCFFIKKELYHQFDVSSDIMELYLDGLKEISRYCIYYQKYLKKYNLYNSIIDHILSKTMFRLDGKITGRAAKRWSQINKRQIDSIISDIRKNKKKWKKVP